jgi:hypothetical protein
MQTGIEIQCHDNRGEFFFSLNVNNTLNHQDLAEFNLTMSGVEVIRLVLGGLPLIFSFAEHYREGFEPLVRWKRFRFDFQKFITTVDTQEQMFKLTLTNLLAPVQLEPEEKQKLLTMPDYEGWHRSDVVEALRSRLGDTYDACMGTSYSPTKSCFLVLGCPGSRIQASETAYSSLSLSLQLDFRCTNAAAGILRTMNEDMVDLQAMMSLKDGTVCITTRPPT